MDLYRYLSGFPKCILSHLLLTSKPNHETNQQTKDGFMLNIILSYLIFLPMHKIEFNPPPRQ